jgi:purine-nucleoside phosphorylase
MAEAGPQQPERGLSEVSGTIEAEAGEAVAFLRGSGFGGLFDCAMVMGTGLGGLADEIEDVVAVSYADVPHFPIGKVSGHAGRLIAGTLEGRRVLLFQGRAHYYETGDAAAMRVPIATIKALGATRLLLTNASGSTSLDVPPGSLVIITDHINLSGASPLMRDSTEERFVSLTHAYDANLRRRLKHAGEVAGVPLREGVYAWFSGPNFETPAEIRMARLLGADLVGMSTVPEVILARYYGIGVAAISVVTNFGAGLADSSPTHQDTRAGAAGAATDLGRLVRAFLAGLHDA